MIPIKITCIFISIRKKRKGHKRLTRIVYFTRKSPAPKKQEKFWCTFMCMCFYFYFYSCIFWTSANHYFLAINRKPKHRSFTKRPFTLTPGNYCRVHCSYVLLLIFFTFYCRLFSPVSLMHLLYTPTHANMLLSKIAAPFCTYL